MAIEFWIRRTQGTDFTISDLGTTIVASGGERNLHASHPFERIIESSDLATAFSGGDLVKLDGPTGSPVTLGTEFYDIAQIHNHQHESGRLDELSVDGLSGTLADPQPAEDHATSHAPSGTDALSTAAPATVGTANAEGTAETFARSDHVHSGLTRGAADFDTFTPKTSIAAADLFLIEDSAVANAKKKITAANAFSGLAQYETQISYSGIATSTTTSDTLIVNLTYTPTAGTYLVSVGGSIQSSIKARTMYVSIYVGGVQVSGSEVIYQPGENEQSIPFAIANHAVTVNGSQAIEVRWRATAGLPPTTMTATNRRMTLIKVV